MHLHRVELAHASPRVPAGVSDAMHTARFLLLDVDLTVVSNCRSLLEPIRALLGAFETGPGNVATERPDPGGARCTICVETLSSSCQRLTIDERRFAISGRTEDLLGHLYAVLFDTVFERSHSALLVHGAALQSGGEVTVVSGPSGTGKSTLAFVGARRFGWHLSSDDVAPLDLASGHVRPFPKALSIRSGILEPDALGPHVEFPVLGGRSKCLFQPGAVGITQARADAKLRRLVFLVGPEDGVARSSPEVTVVVHQFSTELLKRIAGSSHVERVRLAPAQEIDSPHPHLRVNFASELKGMWDVMEACRESGALVLGVNKSSTSPAERFLTAPTLERMDLESATRATLRNLWGTAQFGGTRVGGAALFGRVAAALDDVDCYRLRPGSFDATLELVRTVVES